MRFKYVPCIIQSYFSNDDSLEIKIGLWGMCFAWISDSVESQVIRWQRLCYAFTAICSLVECWLYSKGPEYISHMVKQLLLHQREANLSIMLRDSAERRTRTSISIGFSLHTVEGKQGQPEGRERAKEWLIRWWSEYIKTGEMNPKCAQDESEERKTR